MGMKVKLSPSFLSPKHYLHSSSSSSPAVADDVFKTLNSVYFDSAAESSDDDDPDEEEEDIESIIRRARSGTSRLLFEPSTAKAISDSAPPFIPLLSLLDSKSATEEEVRPRPGPWPFKESLVMAMESEDPYMDFRRSMEEMMETHPGLLRDWGCLEDLLAWYLKVNGKNNHAYIVAAFVDFLIKFSSSSSSSSCSGVLNSPKLNHEGCSNCSCSTSRSSSRSTSCACVCGDHHLRRMGNKSTTSFSSAASSFSNCDVHD